MTVGTVVLTTNVNTSPTMKSDEPSLMVKLISREV
jgi:hypothetical protein